MRKILGAALKDLSFESSRETGIEVEVGATLSLRIDTDHIHLMQ